METNARHLLIGSFVVVGVLSMLAFAMWIAHFGFDEKIYRYDIFFEETVAGLGEGGDVTYRGIKVGRVESLAIDPDDPELVRTTIRVRNTPIRQGDRATLHLQGITGVTYINIEGASKDSPLLEVEHHQPRAVIPCAPSPFGEMLQEAPDVFSKMNLVLDRVGGVFNQENRQRFGLILEETEDVMRGLNEREQQVGELLAILLESRDDIHQTSSALRRSAEGFEALAAESRASVATAHSTLQGLEGVVNEDLRATLAEYRTTAVSLRESTEMVERILLENEEAFDRFLGHGLPELQALAADTRRLVNRIAVLTDDLEARGAGVLLPPKPAEFEVSE